MTDDKKPTYGTTLTAAEVGVIGLPDHRDSILRDPDLGMQAFHDPRPLSAFGVINTGRIESGKWPTPAEAIPLILRDVCELPPASELELDTIIVSREDLERILRHRLEGKE